MDSSWGHLHGEARGVNAAVGLELQEQAVVASGREGGRERHDTGAGVVVGMDVEVAEVSLPQCHQVSVRAEVRLQLAAGVRIGAVDRDPESIATLNNVPGVTAKVCAAGADSVEQNPGGWALIVAKQMIYYFDRRDAPSFVATFA